MNKKIAMALFAGVTVTVVLSSCSSVVEVSGEYPDLSLAQSKSPTQLLRNETAARIPPEVIDTTVTQTDESVGCLSTDIDPDATVRSWKSTAQVALTEDSSGELETVVTGLVDSFEEQGWAAAALGGTSRGGSKLLFSETAAQSIQIVGLSANEERPDVWDGEAVTRASVLVVVSGPCVRTDGADSDEVEQLENAAG